MKMKITASAVAAVATLLLSDSAFAQQTKSNFPGLLSGSQIERAEVMNLQNQQIGTIEEILVDPSSGKVRFAVLNVGGFLGIGETEVALPWDAVQVSKSGEKAKFVVDATKEKLEKAPRVEGKKYDRLYSRQDAEPTFIYWGITWYDIGPLSTPSASASPSPSPKK